MLIITMLIFLIFAVRGWQRGFLQVLFTLVSVIVLIALALWLAPQVTAFLVEKTGASDGIGARLLTILIAGLAAFIIVRLIARALKLVNKIPVLGKINRFFGLLAGLAEALILMWVIMTGIHFWAVFHPDAAILQSIGSSEFLSWLYGSDPLAASNHNI